MTTPTHLLRTAEEVLEAACAAVEAEEELDGPIPDEVKRETLADPERSLRAAVVATKRGIAKRIRTLAARIAPESQPAPRSGRLGDASWRAGERRARNDPDAGGA